MHTALSKGYWLDIMKAAQEQGEAGNPAVMMIATNLVQSLVNIARQLAGKSWVEYEQAEGYFERSIIDSEWQAGSKWPMTPFTR